MDISIRRNNRAYIICIKDNGIGRNRAKEIQTFGTGKGLSILDQILDLYLSLEKTKIIYDIEDLYDKDKNSLGTKVKIRIPIIFDK